MPLFGVVASGCRLIWNLPKTYLQCGTQPLAIHSCVNLTNHNISGTLNLPFQTQRNQGLSERDENERPRPFRIRGIHLFVSLYLARRGRQPLAIVVSACTARVGKASLIWPKEGRARLVCGSRNIGGEEEAARMAERALPCVGERATFMGYVPSARRG